MATKASKSNKEIIKLFKQGIEKAAAKLAMDPSQIDNASFWMHAPGSLQEWDLRKLGGFDKMLSAIYPQKAVISRQRGATKRSFQNIEDTRIILDNFLENLKEVPFNKIKPFKLQQVKKAKTDRVVVLTLSDLHFGADIRKDETGRLEYSRMEESRRFAAVIKQVINYKYDHRDSTELVIFLIGDVIQNNLHDPRDGDIVAAQMARASWLLTCGLKQLAAHYKKVTVYCSTGNHGRNKARHFERAVHSKGDSLETSIYYSVKLALANQSNVDVQIPMTPYVSVDILGHKMLATHGDTVINPGNPGSAIKIKQLADQINRINASLNDREEYKVVIVGHVHIGSMTHLDNGAVMITNGALCPVDAFAVSIGAMENSAGQQLFEVTRSHAVGDARYIKVGLKDDLDASLDQIIEPWPGF
jgi:predicted phosphodiesterase